jgi:hypothetical protein
MIGTEDSFLPVLIVSNDTISSCNSIFSKLVGKCADELVNQPLHKYLHFDSEEESVTSNITCLLEAASVSETGYFAKAMLMDVNFHYCKVDLHCQQYNDNQSNIAFKFCFNVIENKSIDSITGLPNGWAISARATHLFKLPNV